MNARLALLRRRREMLALRAQAQRLEIEAIAQSWRKPMAFADTVVAAARRANRYWLIYTLVLAFVVRTRRVPLGLWIGRMWTAWEVYRSFRPRGRRARSANRTIPRTS